VHDDVGSNLSTISLLSRRAQKQHAQGQPSNEDLTAINRIAGQTANSVREIVWFINPEYDTMQDLVLRMKDAAGSILSGIDWDFQSPPTDLSRKLTLQVRQNLFLLYKEALTNAARHSQATRVDINIQNNGDGWKLSVRDNGVGFNPEESHSGNGLKNLRLRAVKLNGELAVESGLGQGTTVIFSTIRF
jgi:signal transduction histidine kinase